MFLFGYKFLDNILTQIGIYKMFKHVTTTQTKNNIKIKSTKQNQSQENQRKQRKKRKKTKCLLAVFAIT
jgi:hypothetical protein